jgi:hypothetical protein
MNNHTLTTRPKRTVLALVALAVVAALGLTGCGSNAKTPTSTSSAQKLAITIKGSSITPTKKRIPVKLNQPLTITITADRSGELHVHSSPEQHIEFTSGTTVKKITFKVPGLIELEEHKTNTLIAQLEVR